jgi:hypothetical protein
MGQYESVIALDDRGIPPGGEVVKLCDVGGEFPALLITQLLAADGIGAVVQSDEMPLQPGWNFGARPWGRVMVLDADLPRASEIISDLNEEIECEGGFDFTISRTWFPNLHIGELNRGEVSLLALVLLLVSVFVSPAPAVLAPLIALAALPHTWRALAVGICLVPAAVAFSLFLPFLIAYCVLRPAALALWDWVDRLSGGLLKRARW